MVRVARGASVSLRPVISFVETLVASGNGAALSAAHIDILPSPCTPIDSHSVISREVPAIVSSARGPDPRDDASDALSAPLWPVGSVIKEDGVRRRFCADQARGKDSSDSRLLIQPRVRLPDLHTPIITWTAPCVEGEAGPRNDDRSRSRVDIPTSDPRAVAVSSDHCRPGTSGRVGMEALAITASDDVYA